MKRKFLLIIGIIAVSIGITAFNILQEPVKWIVPEKYLKMTNPLKADARSINAGRSFFKEYCKDCHGKKGLGNGMKAPDLKIPPADLTTTSVQNQSDGSLYYKISEGHKQMPRNKKDIPDSSDIWDIVNFLRTLTVKGL